MTIGIDLGMAGVKAGIVEGGVVYQKIVEVLPLDRTETESVDFLVSVIKRLFNTNVKGIGISVPAVVDSNDGIVYHNPTNLPKWKEVHLRKILEKEFRVPVQINNDSNCLAFAERYYGEATPYRNIVAVKMSNGLGAGVIINDVLYNGWNTGAGEIGHLPYLDGTYEDYCGLSFFKKHDTSGYINFLRAKEGDRQALGIWRDFGFHVGNLVKTILFTYDPQAIILGGEASLGYPYFSERMYEQVFTFPYIQTLRRIKILPSQKEDIALLGAAALIP